MAACLRSLLLEYCDRILLCSEYGMFTYSLNSSHRPSSMLSSTVERFSGVRVSPGNTQEKQMERLNTQLYTNNCVALMYA